MTATELPALATRGVSVRFGGNHVLDRVDLAVRPGSITGLIGPNGAGKTTLFDVLSGLVPARHGSVLLGDRDITRLPPHRRARLGLARTFQRLELFGSLTVRENLRVAGAAGHGDDVAHLMDVLGLDPIADRAAADLPTGAARLVELGRALMTKPAVLLLDEPGSGQSAHDTDRFAALLRGLATSGRMTVMLVEHDLSLVRAVCDEVHVLVAGRLIATGSPEEIMRDPKVLDTYVGTGSGPR